MWLFYHLYHIFIFQIKKYVYLIIFSCLSHFRFSNWKLCSFWLFSHFLDILDTTVWKICTYWLFFNFHLILNVSYWKLYQFRTFWIIQVKSYSNFGCFFSHFYHISDITKRKIFTFWSFFHFYYILDGSNGKICTFWLFFHFYHILNTSMKCKFSCFSILIIFWIHQIEACIFWLFFHFYHMFYLLYWNSSIFCCFSIFRIFFITEIET